MYQDGVRPPGYGLVEQALTGRDTGGQAGNPGATFNLQAVGAVIPKLVGLQTTLQILD
jgi:hypothetical protein